MRVHARPDGNRLVYHSIYRLASQRCLPTVNPSLLEYITV